MGEQTVLTVPMALSFALRTGTNPETRMRPWMVFQVTLDEQEWFDLVEYIAAPYDPRTDTPKTKPWAYLRYQQRGTGTPWTDEFADLVIEPATRPGIIARGGTGQRDLAQPRFPAFIGFGLRETCSLRRPGVRPVHPLPDRAAMKKSPYWKSQGLDRKIRFYLGANYVTTIRPDGKCHRLRRGGHAGLPIRDPAGPRQLRRPEVGDGRPLRRHLRRPRRAGDACSAS